MLQIAEALELCKFVADLTGVHATLLDLRNGTFACTPYARSCQTALSTCDAYTTHIYNAYEAERWSGGYVYYCPRGLTFIAIPLIHDRVMNHCMTVGPIVMSNDDDPYAELVIGGELLERVPRMSTAQIHAFSEWLFLTYYSGPARGGASPSKADTRLLTEYFYQGLRRDPQRVQMERQLQAYIRSGDKPSAQQLLNELLVTIYNDVNFDTERLKPQIQEIFVSIGRAAIDGGADRETIYQLCCSFSKELEELSDFEQLNHWLGAVLHQFTRTVFDFKDIGRQNMLFLIDSYVNQHLAEKITLNGIAAHAYVSPSYFCRLIRASMGCTFTEYLTGVRLERAKALLCQTAMSIAEVALSTGFEDQSYFTRVFKKKIGTSPKMFRVNSQKEGSAP